MCFINYTEMARVTGVPFNYLLSRGQSIKVLSQLFRKANDDGYVIPALRGEGLVSQSIVAFFLVSDVDTSQARTSSTKVQQLSNLKRDTTMFPSPPWILARCTRQS